ncbi:MAG: S-layer homology domain-containing protein, partial [bacterium]
MVAQVASAFFSDVSETYTYHDAISYIKDQGIVQGYGDGTYKPDNLITRAEFTKIIILTKYTEDEAENCVPTKKFPDVPAKEWYAKYICLAKNNDIVKGYEDGTYKPNNNISFAEAAKIVANTYGLELTSEADSPEHWYMPFVDALYLQAAVPMTITTDYGKLITRGEMAETIFGVETEQGYTGDDTGITLDPDDTSDDVTGNDTTDDVTDDTSDDVTGDDVNDDP